MSIGTESLDPQDQTLLTGGTDQRDRVHAQSVIEVLFQVHAGFYRLPSRPGRNFTAIECPGSFPPIRLGRHAPGSSARDFGAILVQPHLADAPEFILPASLDDAKRSDVLLGQPEAQHPSRP